MYMILGKMLNFLRVFFDFLVIKKIVIIEPDSFHMVVVMWLNEAIHVKHSAQFLAHQS